MLAMSLYLIVFRIVHITAGVAWAGSVFLFVTAVQPSAAAIAPAGAPFMAELLGKRKLVDSLIGLGSTTVIGGLFLYWHDMNGYGGIGDFVGTSFGLSLTIGAVAALLALGFGIFVTKPNVMRMLALGRQIAESGGPPSPEQAAEMGRIQKTLKIFARTSLTLIFVAVLAMATARAWQV